MRILVADDSRVMRKIYRGVLEGMGYPEGDVLEAADGTEAVRALAESRPEVDLVIADWDLPGLEGPSFLELLRGGTARKRTAVIFVIGRDQRGTTIEGADFIERPFRDEQLQEKLKGIAAEVNARKTKESADLLRTVVSSAEVELPFLIRLPSRLIEEFLGLSKRAKHPPGKELVRPDEVVESLHVLTAGEVELTGEGGKVEQTCMEGDCFCELSFMLNQPSKVGARAKTPIEVASLSRVALGELLRRHPTMADYLSTLMARRWKKTGTTRITRRESDLMGSLESMPFSDVVQLLNVTQKTGVLGFREGGLAGGIYFTGGEVTHAWLGELQGEEAFFKLATLKKARFGFNARARKEPQTVEQPTMTLLMEAMRRLDEGDRSAPPPA
jgi:CheY-like chemotaxis protein